MASVDESRKKSLQEREARLHLLKQENIAAGRWPKFKDKKNGK